MRVRDIIAGPPRQRKGRCRGRRFPASSGQLGLPWPAPDRRAGPASFVSPQSPARRPSVRVYDNARADRVERSGLSSSISGLALDVIASVRHNHAPARNLQQRLGVTATASFLGHDLRR